MVGGDLVKKEQIIQIRRPLENWGKENEPPEQIVQSIL